MRTLLTEEMKRALVLIQRQEENKINDWSETAELKQILKMIRKHSIMYENESLKY